MKRFFALCLCGTLLLSLSACSPSPTAVTVGSSKVDASEVAFYLNYNRSVAGTDTQVYTADATQKAKDAALEQIITNEIVRQKCKELKLSISDDQQEQIDTEKAALIDSLGGKAAYVTYLQSSYLTDRAYDKFQENAIYYELLYNAVLEKNQDKYTDEYLRQYFSENYISVRYICLSRLDNDGNPLGEEEDAAKKQQAEEALSAALAENADLAAVIQQYNEDPSMAGATDGITLSRLKAEASYDFLLPAFDLDVGEIDGLFTADSGYYILIRGSVSADYYTEYQEDVFQNARDHDFNAQLAEWKAETSVSTSKTFSKMTLENLSDYIK